MDRPAAYREAVRRRRGFALPGYASLADVGQDGPWVIPIQQSSGNLAGPMLISKDWLDAPTARRAGPRLAGRGYLPGMVYNRVLDRALALLGLQRGDIYITTIFCLLPPRRSHPLAASACRAAFDAVGRFELMGRRPVALGADAARTLRQSGVAAVETLHPSARGIDFDTRARAIASALEAA